MTVPVSPYLGPDKNIRGINLWWIYRRTLKALNFSIHGVTVRKEALDSRDGDKMPRTQMTTRVIDMFMLIRYAKYTWDRYHSLHTYGKVIPFLSNRDKQTLIFQRRSYGLYSCLSCAWVSEFISSERFQVY